VRVERPSRPWTFGEEISHAVSHGVGAALAIAGLAGLLVVAFRRGDAWDVVSSAVFGTTLVLLYTASTLYHSIPGQRAKKVFRILDHSAIYLLIAGTYTPFTLGVLGGVWGSLLFGLVWSLAAVGVALKAFDRLAHPLLSTALYLVMGWLVVIAIGPLIERIPLPGLALLAGGGLAYTAGVFFFATDSRLRYGHLVWHMFVVAGTTCHFFAVLWYAA